MCTTIFLKPDPVNTCMSLQSTFIMEANTMNTIMPSLLFVGHRQTVQTKIRCHRMQHLIRVSTVCLHIVLLKLIEIEIYYLTTIKFKNGFVQLIRVGNSIRLKWVTSDQPSPESGLDLVNF